jgi:energy-coupling factor transporter ATP-binding protein EcfA2
MQPEESQNGFQWGIQSIEFSGGERVGIETASVTALIGPNNSGKSRALREILGVMTNQGANRVVVRDIDCFRHGTLEGLNSWLSEHYIQRTIDEQKLWTTIGIHMGEPHVAESWKQGNFMPPLYPYLLRLLDAESRLNVSRPVETIDLYRQPQGAYIHVLQMDEPLLQRVSQEVRDAFGVGLVINWGSGKQVGLHVGPEPERTREQDRVSEAYLRAVNRLPRLETEGDGIRSFVGTLLASECGAHLVLLIDEPEAFLHPPQARRLGAALAKSAVRLGRQIILATHSSDIIQGALGASKRVSICRITREDTVNHVAMLKSEDLKGLLEKPQLRSSAAIDGVFHEGVVVCEGDADCRFYEAILRRLEAQRGVGGPVDLYFVHGGGKGELATFARAYRGLSVRVAVIADLDLMRNRAEFEKLIGVLGGDFETLRSDYISTCSALAALPPQITARAATARLRELATEIELQTSVTTEHRKALDELIREAADWSQAKRYGIYKLKGGARAAGERLLNQCADLGLFLVPFGELESWWRAGPAEKNEWFLQAIEEIATNGESFHKASLFVAKVCQNLGRPVSVDTAKLFVD